MFGVLLKSFSALFIFVEKVESAYQVKVTSNALNSSSGMSPMKGVVNDIIALDIGILICWHTSNHI
jgi:hypothetical protein